MNFKEDMKELYRKGDSCLHLSLERWILEDQTRDDGLLADITWSILELARQSLLERLTRFSYARFGEVECAL